MQVWAGLRGAVGLSLSLFVLLDNTIEDLRYRTLSFFFMGMMVSAALCPFYFGTAPQSATPFLFSQPCVANAPHHLGSKTCWRQTFCSNSACRMPSCMFQRAAGGHDAYHSRLNDWATAAGEPQHDCMCHNMQFHIC